MHYHFMFLNDLKIISLSIHGGKYHDLQYFWVMNKGFVIRIRNLPLQYISSSLVAGISTWRGTIPAFKRNPFWMLVSHLLLEVQSCSTPKEVLKLQLESSRISFLAMKSRTWVIITGMRRIFNILYFTNWICEFWVKTFLFSYNEFLGIFKVNIII